MRQHMKRFARPTAGHSKKIDNHVHMVALYTTWYNYRQDQQRGSRAARYGLRS